jgi:flagellar protein FlbD
MIHLTRLNRNPVIINADLIEHIDANPDTVVSLTNGQKFMVLESTEDVIDRVIDYRRMVLSQAGLLSRTPSRSVD